MIYNNIDIIGTECCDICSEVINNLFNCPVCNSYEYLTVSENLSYETREYIECEKCNTKFKKHEEDIEDSWYIIDRLVSMEDN